ncbi:MAG TPA: hypothetical protein VE549_13780 [Myxococcaceae bacterium]|jgi:hypothetical protein|nr:hypothetical protein [Myxococcaceae bacterium]
MRPFQLAAVAVSVLLVPIVAVAKAVYLNDVRIDNVQGIRNLKLEKATVRIDDKGDIFIDAPGYQIKIVDQGAGGSGGQSATTTVVGDESVADAKLTRRYFLVTEQSAPGLTDYDIDVFVNSKWIRKLKNADEQTYVEITRHLVPGRNLVLLNARKVGTGARKSYSAEHVFRVIIGEGNVGGNHVMIDRTVVDFKRTAADQENVSKEFSFVTR